MGNNTKKCKLFPAIIIALGMTVNFAAGVFADDKEAVYVGSDFAGTFEYAHDSLEIEMIPISEDELEAVKQAGELNREATVSAQIPKRYEALYNTSNLYYYNQMNTGEKDIYNKIVQSCNDLLNSYADVTDYNGKYYYADYIPLSTPLSVDTVHQIIYAVYFSNPQFFFLNNAFSYYDNKSGDVTSVAPMIRNEYADGSVRMDANLKIQNITNEWMRQINALRSDLDKEKWIAQKLCETITYQDSEYDQTIAGALIYQKCVCNGYAMAMTYFCNAAGINCMMMTGNNHAWNRIQLNGVWYEVDVTWMDMTDYLNIYIYTDWFNKSHEAFLSNDDERNSHRIDSKHTGILSLQDCISDYPACKTHIWEKGIITRQPTATEKGYQFRWCTACSAGEIAVICPSRYHKYSYKKYEFDGSSHWQICVTCQTESEKKAHTFSDDICTVCGYSVSIGDINGDGVLSPRDITILGKAYMSDTADQYVAIADMNSDGHITPKDITALGKLYMSL